MSARATILVVEDDGDLRELLELMLASSGYEVATAANGREALVQFDRVHPALVLLDMKMPVMDGWQFVRTLDARGRRPPIVVLTAAPDPAERAAEVHAEGWLGKPFEYEALQQVLRQFAG